MTSMAGGRQGVKIAVYFDGQGAFLIIMIVIVTLQLRPTGVLC